MCVFVPVAQKNVLFAFSNFGLLIWHASLFVVVFFVQMVANSILTLIQVQIKFLKTVLSSAHMCRSGLMLHRVSNCYLVP